MHSKNLLEGLMKPLRILICGGDVRSLQRTAQALADEGAKIAISTNLIDNLCFSDQEWDFLLIDLDGLTSFLRSLLPTICRRFPNLPIIGVSTRPVSDIIPANLGYGVELDDYIFGSIRLEDLIVRFPHVAEKYVCDTGALGALGTQPLTN